MKVANVVCLKNISFNLFVNKKNLNDKYVFDLRDKYFSKINSS